MSSSRQKSCLACVRAKRRCDQGFPKCRRCVARKVDCEYPSRIFGQSPQNVRSEENQDFGFAERFAGEEPAGSSQLQRRSPALSAARLSPCMNDAFINFGNEPFNLPYLPGDDFLSPTIIENIMSQQQLQQPLQQDPGDDDVGRIKSDMGLQSRVEFAAKRLAAIPKTFAEQAHTMFVHRRLFQERNPAALQDALSACALYCLKTPENQALVFRNLEHKSQQLIAAIDPHRVSKVDLLAALQALVMYQVIRLFDGDVRLRAQAEADEPVLVTWAAQLKSRTRQLAPSLSESSTPASASPDALLVLQDRAAYWQRWLVEESCRRTVIVALMVKGVYGFLKTGFDRSPSLRMSFTAQAALWGAQSEYGWRTAYYGGERERLEVRMMHWDEDMAKATPGDLEELGVLIMSMFRGLEVAEDWLGRAYLLRYGLER